jgi:hypothetical protein
MSEANFLDMNIIQKSADAMKEKNKYKGGYLWL